MGFYSRAGPIKNRYFWLHVDKLLRSRLADTVKISKVRGHATSADVLSGRVQLIDKIGNDNADALAVAGAFKITLGSADREALHRQLLLA